MKQIEIVKANGSVEGMADIHMWIDSAVMFVSNGSYTLTLDRVVKRRSLNQNRLMWMWFKCIELELGQPSQDIHDHYCKMLLSREIADPVTGETERVYSGTSGLNTAQMTDFLNGVQADAASELGITLPSPDDYGYEDFELEYGKYIQ